MRDKLMGRANRFDDIDLVLEGDALAVADLLWRRRVADHKPVEYGQYGTTQIEVGGEKVEIVTARSETYRQGSRASRSSCRGRWKRMPSGGILRSTRSWKTSTPARFATRPGADERTLDAGILRTPHDPDVIFTDDALRMLRACRFAAKLGFTIEPTTYAGIVRNADKCNAENGISFERVREELSKTLLAPGAARGLELMRGTGLMAQFAPELAALHGVTQNKFHLYDVWEHTLVALANLPADADLEVRLGVLLHDIGKPATRTEDADGGVHFYLHEEVGADIARVVLTRLRFPNDTIDAVTRMVRMHMRYGAYRRDWREASVRRLMRDVGAYREALYLVAEADRSACATHDPATGEAFRDRRPGRTAGTYGARRHGNPDHRRGLAADRGADHRAARCSSRSRSWAR